MSWTLLIGYLCVNNQLVMGEVRLQRFRFAASPFGRSTVQFLREGYLVSVESD